MLVGEGKRRWGGAAWRGTARPYSAPLDRDLVKNITWGFLSRPGFKSGQGRAKNVGRAPGDANVHEDRTNYTVVFMTQTLFWIGRRDRNSRAVWLNLLQVRQDEVETAPSEGSWPPLL